MKKTTIMKKAFTLIELLVVITIIGILATGATSVYTSQIQKARDTIRINDLDALKMSIEQAYQDSFEYPGATKFKNEVLKYMDSLPRDPKVGQNCNKGNESDSVICVYSYKVRDDDNGIENGAYEISTAFENTGNIDSKAEKDNGNDSQRLEMGVGNTNLNIITKVTSFTGSADENIGTCLLGGGEPTDDGEQIAINGTSSSGTLCEE